MNHLGFVEPVDRLGQGVVIAVALATHRGFYAGLSHALGVANGDVLATPLGMVNQGILAARQPSFLP